MFSVLVYVLGVLLLTDEGCCLCPLLLSFSLWSSGQIHGRPDMATHRLMFSLNIKLIGLPSAILNIFL